MSRIPFCPFPTDIYVDACGRAVNGSPQFAKSVNAVVDNEHYRRFAKQAVVTNDNQCLEYYWSYWAKLVSNVDGISHYRLEDTGAAPFGKVQVSDTSVSPGVACRILPYH